MPTAITAASFTNSIGVEIHQEYSAPCPYGSMSTVEAALAYLNPNGIGTGVATVRDESGAPVSELATLGSLGYKLDIYTSYNAGANNNFSAVDSTDSTLVNDGYVRMIEGPLEVDNAGWGLVNGASYTALNGQTYTGWQAAVMWQEDLYNTFSGKTEVALFSLANPSDGAANSAAVQAASQLGTSLTSISNVGNVHFYEHNGNAPETEMPGVISQETGYTPGKGFTITETGFNDLDNGSTNYWGSDYSNGVYTLDLVLDAFKAGSQLTDLYELFDENNGYSGSEAFEDHWGLFNANGTPKDSATFLRNMLAVLGDTGANAATFTPGPLNYSVSGLGSNGQSLLMEKSNGAFDIAVWADANIDAGGVASTAPTQTVTVNLGATFGTVEVFDPVQGSSPVETLSNVSSVSLGITDHPLIVEVEPSGAAGSPATAGTPAGSPNNEIVFRDPSSGNLGDFLINGGQPSWAGIGWADPGLQVVGTGDFNGNGNDDILFRDPNTGALSQFAMSGNTPTWSPVGQADPSLQVVGTGDFTGNGTDDVLFRDPTSGMLGDFLMNGGQPTWETIGWTDPGLQVIGVGNFNGGATDDILFRDGSGNVSEFSMNNNQATWAPLGWVDPGLQAVGMGDFTGNGADDILFRDPNTGALSDLLMSNGQPTWAPIGATDPSWQVAGVGNYNGNGTDDIVLRNAGTGVLGEFTMHNNQPTWSEIGWAASNWQVAG